ncbi:MAG: hypothetical protein C0631_09295 [Sedimenticola sp.]|nr:MAG: hypothetical protein C0631_09295 [Sedimenticola sp.]
MNRRNFIKGLVASHLAATGFLSGSPLSYRIRPARAANGKTLIVIFQRGGCDGLNVVVPFGDPNYYALRPSIAIPRPSSDPTSALNLDNFFGLHPSMKPMHDIFTDGNLAVMPAVHYRDASRSHFDGQQQIESGTAEKLADGWLNRQLQSEMDTAMLRAIGFGSGLPHSLRGDASVVTFNDLSQFGLGDDNPQSQLLRTRLRSIFEQATTEDQYNRALIQKSGLTLLDNLSLFDQIDIENYSPENGAEYPNSSFGRQLRQTAQLIKENVGLEIATVDIGGWDSHSNQGGGEENGSQARNLAQFASGIHAIYTDLGDRMNDIVILTMTEFGRTAKENASRGTDHGNAAAWFAIGHSIRGGVFGDWPGLAASQLYEGRYLAHSIDFRDVFTEVLSRHLGTRNLTDVIPEHSYTPIGFLG